MSAETAISVRNLGKSYILNHQKSSSYKTLSESLAGGLKQLTGKGRKENEGSRETFWALKDISFDVGCGQVLGVIGRNGAGKSTLLKILSRITEPTNGYGDISGRVGSLLEVGTGFHPELTGRENIYLNGTLLGMRKKQIDKLFDEIVDFSQIEKFLDTPVKRYSSGMYMRLAFAIAAHMDLEIMIIDEVLAVGDAAFQKKCLGRMEEVSKSGRTIVFVSHNMQAVESLCSSILWLDNGSTKEFTNDVHGVVSNYLHQGTNSASLGIWNPDDSLKDNGYFDLISMRVIDIRGQIVTEPIQRNQKIFVEITGRVKTEDPALVIGVQIINSDGVAVYWSCHTDKNTIDNSITIMEGVVKFTSELPSKILNEGDYFIELIGGLHFRTWFFEPNKGNPTVQFSICGKLSESPFWMVRRPGIIAPHIDWKVEMKLTE